MPRVSGNPARLGRWRSNSPPCGGKPGQSQQDLARKLKTSQQQISRLESPGYEGHSLRMLRRLTKVLHARVRVVLEAEHAGQTGALTEANVPYRVRRNASKAAPSQVQPMYR